MTKIVPKQPVSWQKSVFKRICEGFSAAFEYELSIIGIFVMLKLATPVAVKLRYFLLLGFKSVVLPKLYN